MCVGLRCANPTYGNAGENNWGQSLIKGQNGLWPLRGRRKELSKQERFSSALQWHSIERSGCENGVGFALAQHKNQKNVAPSVGFSDASQA